MKRVVVILSILSIGIGLYLFFLIGAPEVYFWFRNRDEFIPNTLEASAQQPISATVRTLNLSTAVPTDGQLYDIGNTVVINDIGVVLDIDSSNSKQALEDGAWHRKPYQGNPEIGGNFIVTAHRYGFGWTPNRVAENSGFYHIDKLNIGDEINIYWNQRRYDYVVETKYSSHPNDVNIEAPTTEHMLTLYTCTLGGSSDGRVIIRARPVNS